MADPVSVAGSAVGVISLGLSACQGLIAFYGFLKAQDEEIGNICRKAEGLKATLEALQHVLPTCKATNPNETQTIEQRIVDCDDILIQLDKAVGKCRISSQVKLKSDLKAMKKKALYPFKRDTLFWLLETLEGTQTNLNTALFVLQVKTTQRQEERIKWLGGLLESNPIDDQEKSEKLRQLEEKTSKILEILPSLQTVSGFISNESDKTQGLPLNPRCVLRSTCSCTKEATGQTISLSQRFVSMYRLLETSHHWNCPFHKVGERKETLGVKFSLYCYLLNLAIKAEICLITAPGKLAITPQLNFRNIVPETSPAFQIFDWKRAPQLDLSPCADYGVTTSQFLEAMIRDLYSLFDEGKCSPYDVSPYGQTILHQACTWVGIMLFSCPSFADQGIIWSYRQFLKAIINTGVPLNEEDDEGAWPLDNLTKEMIFWNSFDGLGLEIFALITLDLLNLGAKFSEASIFPLPHRTRLSLNVFEEVLKSEESAEGFCMNDMTKAICIKSESQLLRACINKSSLHAKDREGRTPLHLAAGWPRGVELLLHEGADLWALDISNRTPLCYACFSLCEESIQKMLNAGSPLHHFNSDTNCFEGHWGLSAIVDYMIISHGAQRRRQLQDLAESVLPPRVVDGLQIRHDRVLDDQALQVQEALEQRRCLVPTHIKKYGHERTVYHMGNLSCDVADMLFDVGFRDLDCPNKDGRTPLMQVGTGNGDLIRSLNLAKWFVSKGADINRKFPGSSATVRHQIATDIGIERGSFWPSLGSDSFFNHRFSILGRDFQHQDLLSEVLMVECHDTCVCSCSRRGCSAISMLIKSFFEKLEHSLRRNAQLEQSHHLRLLLLIDLADFIQPQVDSKPSLWRDVIRSATFDTMGLTHTCCRSKAPGISHLESCEIQEIHEEEQSMFIELEGLISDLETTFKQSGSSLAEFLKDCWSVRTRNIGY